MRLALADVHSILSALIEATDDFTLVLDGEFRILRSSRKAETLLGRSAAGLEGRPVEECIVPEGREGFLRLARSMKRTRAGKVTFLSKQGERQQVCFNLAAFQLRSGAGRGFVLAGRSLGEEALPRGCVDASNGLARRMLSGFADPVFLIDGRSRKVGDCNRAAVETFGFPREEVLGRRLLDRGMDEEHRREARRIAAEAWRTYGTAGVYQARINYPVRGGGFLPCDLTGLPFFGPDGSLESIIVILVERTAEATRDAELTRLAEEVKSFACKLSTMAGNRCTHLPGPSLSDMGFTPRQVEILGLSTSGASAKEMGFQLGIAESTVKNHLSAIYRKLGVTSRVGCLSAIVSRHIRIE